MNTVHSSLLSSNAFSLHIITDGCCDWNSAKHVATSLGSFPVGFLIRISLMPKLQSIYHVSRSADDLSPDPTSTSFSLFSTKAL